MAASPSQLCPWQGPSTLHPGGPTSTRQQQSGEVRQVQLSWLQNLCKAIPRIQILSGNRALLTSLSTKLWALRSDVYARSESRGYTKLQDMRGRRQPWHSLPQCCLCLFRHKYRSDHNYCRTCLFLPVLFKQPAPFFCLYLKAFPSEATCVSSHTPEITHPLLPGGLQGERALCILSYIAMPRDGSLIMSHGDP